MDQDKLENELLEAGWKTYTEITKEHCTNFYKAFNTATRCLCNNNKVGMQILVHIYHAQRIGDVDLGPGIEIELHGELEDETWVKVTQHGGITTLDDITRCIPRMLRMWEAAHGQNA